MVLKKQIQSFLILIISIKDMFKIKQKFEDFIVEEIMDIELKPKGRYSYFILEKTNWTTPLALDAISKRLSINPLRLSVAGMKDKKAITKQYLSIYDFPKEKMDHLKIKDIKLRFLGYSDKPINIGQSQGNKFRIIVRNLKNGLNKIDYLTNYYDEQRFGDKRPNNDMVGKYLLQKRYEEAMKNYLARPYSKETKNHREFRKKIEENWGNFNLKNIPNHLILEKKVINYLSKKPYDFQNAFKILPKQILTLFIHAYQSKLFNNILAKYIQENFKKNYKIKYCYGKLPVINQDLNLNLPLIGYNYKFKDNKIDNYLKNLLEKDNIELKDFKFKEFSFLNSKTLMRKSSIKIKNLKINNLEKDEINKNHKKQEISFSLPKGSYATMVIKQLYYKNN